MACKEETRGIGDHEYYCRQWSAEKALLMKLRIAKMFGGAFADLAVIITNKDTDSVSSVIPKLFDTSEPEQVLVLLKEVAQSATCDGKRIDVKNFNDIFSDNLLDFYRVVGFVLEVNFKSFFGGKLPGILESVKARVAET